MRHLCTFEHGAVQDDCLVRHDALPCVVQGMPNDRAWRRQSWLACTRALARGPVELVLSTGWLALASPVLVGLLWLAVLYWLACLASGRRAPHVCAS